MVKIEIKKIWLDINIVNMVQQTGMIFPEEYEENIKPMNTFPLSKERLISTSKIRLPITLQKRGEKYSMYDILDGRHRVTNCILRKEKYIEAEVIS